VDAWSDIYFLIDLSPQNHQKLINLKFSISKIASSPHTRASYSTTLFFVSKLSLYESEIFYLVGDMNKIPMSDPSFEAP
jgi:hypothetical protein